MSKLDKLSKILNASDEPVYATPGDERLAKMAQIAKAVYDGVTRQEFTQAFKALVDALNVSRKELSSEVASIVSSLSKELRADITSRIAQIKDGKDGKDGTDGKDGVGHDGKDGIDGKSIIGPAGKDGSPDTGDQIVDKINKADSLIDRSAVEGLADLEKAMAEKTGTTYRVGWGAHPLQIQGLGVVIDKSTRVINFTGAGLTSVTRTASGIVTVALSGGGSSGTNVSEEIPTDSGDHTNFTIAHTPLTGTFNLYRGGAKQASIGVTPDFSRTGTALTLTYPLDVMNGEMLLCAYSY